jgi:hypothetical protein
LNPVGVGDRDLGLAMARMVPSKSGPRISPDPGIAADGATRKPVFKRLGSSGPIQAGAGADAGALATCLAGAGADSGVSATTVKPSTLTTVKGCAVLTETS